MELKGKQKERRKAERKLKRKLKKAMLLFLGLLACLPLLAACGSPEEEALCLRVGASITPHAEILRQAETALAEQGITLEIVEFTDYVQPNLAVESGDLDANYFQHRPYLEQFNQDNGTHLRAIAELHYEAMGIYKGRLSSLEELYDGASIALPNDATNEARALLLLAANGVIRMREGADLNATVLDIAENPYNIEFIEMEAAQIPLSLQDVDFGIINGNYALQAGLNAAEDAVASEAPDSEGARSYANVLCVKEGNEENEAILALIRALSTEELRSYIQENYGGLVVPLF
ncbi:MAG: MetQ/NlpA family ABC transporter substrate-binding protein [Bacillota bacterium]|nr:MetQ/NlpA family ABC transporter substrate-binding protein [Bacillota bacterium]